MLREISSSSDYSSFRSAVMLSRVSWSAASLLSGEFRLNEKSSFLLFLSVFYQHKSILELDFETTSKDELLS